MDEVAKAVVYEVNKIKMNACFNGNPAATIGLCNRIINKYKEECTKNSKETLKSSVENNLK